MIGPNTNKLLEIASDALGGACCPSLSGSIGADIAEMLIARNGYYAFESALHVFPFESNTGHLSLSDWNSADGWRKYYGRLTEGWVFFAENILGDQFAINDEQIAYFDPETGSFEPIASSLDEWAKRIIEDCDVLLAHPLAHEWQLNNGRIPSGFRLLPKTPFVLGGDYTLDNLYALDARTSMEIRAELAMKILGLPDGTTVRYRIVE